MAMLCDNYSDGTVVEAWSESPYEHPDEFYAVLQAENTTKMRKGGTLYRFKAVVGPFIGNIYQMNARGLWATITGIEPQGVGVFDGRWRFSREGGYLTIKPVGAQKT